MLVFAGTANAQISGLPEPGILPDSPLYFFKRITERIGTFLTFGEVARARRMIGLAEKRLAEAEALAVRGLPEIAERAIQNYQEYLNRAAQRAEVAKERGFDVDNVLEKVAEATLRHQAVLAEVYERVPEQAKPAIERAMQAGLRGHEEALKAVSEERREEVLERVEQRRTEVQQKLEELRREGVPVPALLPTREEIRERIRAVPQTIESPVQNQLDSRVREQERIEEQERAIEREMERLILPEPIIERQIIENQNIPAPTAPIAPPIPPRIPQRGPSR